VQTNLNIGAALVSGIDLQLSYKQELPAKLGRLNFELNGAYLEHSTTTPEPGAHTYDCAGYYGFTCQTINPRWHHVFRATWSTPWDFSASATWRYLGPVSEDSNSPDPTLHLSNPNYALDFLNGRIPSYSYLDLETTWYVGKILTIRAGVNNLLDKDPPLVNTTAVPGGEANTIDVYDMFGRQLFLSFTARF
jgi:iron complex outermembrane recepter protein